jgi:uncharacterized membrane protein YqhA
MSDSTPESLPTDPGKSAIVMLRLLKVVEWTRFVSVLAIVSSLISALVMFWLGTVDTFKAVQLVFTGDLTPEEAERGLSVIATVELLETFDAFLVGLAFLYFAYGIYSLFIRLSINTDTDPPWLQVDSISTLKKTLLEVLVVLLVSVFIKGVLEHLTIQNMNWNLLVIPLSVLAIALSVRLMLPEDKSEE